VRKRPHGVALALPASSDGERPRGKGAECILSLMPSRMGQCVQYARVIPTSSSSTDAWALEIERLAELGDPCVHNASIRMHTAPNATRRESRGGAGRLEADTSPSSLPTFPSIPDGTGLSRLECEGCEGSPISASLADKD
jgi:hypothetical protein